MRKLPLIFLLMLVSCTATKVVPVPIERIEKEKESVFEKDSIFIHDSIIYHHKGDTVYADRWHTKIIERTRIDTVEKCDTITEVKTVEVEKEVNRLYWWQKVLMSIGVLSVFYIIWKLK